MLLGDGRFRIAGDGLPAAVDVFEDVALAEPEADVFGLVARQLPPTSEPIDVLGMAAEELGDLAGGQKRIFKPTLAVARGLTFAPP